MNSQLLKPEVFSFHDENVSQLWNNWKQEFKLYLRASSQEKHKDEVKVALFLNFIGKEGRKIFKTFELDEDTVKLDDVFSDFDDYCNPKKSVPVERYKFLKIKQGESQKFDSFLLDLRSAVENCEYEDLEDSIIRDQIIIGVTNDNLREKLLSLENCDLDKVVSTCRNFERCRNNIDVLKKSEQVHTVQRRNFDTKIINCRNCARQHKINQCPAFNKICSYCNRKNHFFNCCFKRQNDIETKKTFEVQESEDNEKKPVEEIFYINNVFNEASGLKSWYEPIIINKLLFHMKLDTGAEVNILSKSDFLLFKGQYKLHPTNIVLQSFGNSNFKSHAEGYAIIPCDLKCGRRVNIKFIIADVTTSCPIIGLPTCMALKLVTRNTVAQVTVNDKEKVLRENSDLFDGLGCFPKDYHIIMDSNVSPVVYPPRRIPETLHDKLKRKLCEMEVDGIISRIEEPTEWVSPLLIREKKDGSLRICLDPIHLNKAIVREHFLMPTPEEITSKLAGNEIFSVIDMKNGFWQVKLDEESSLLCTFNSPFGKFKFNRLPFGLCCSPEVFQRCNMQVFGDLEGVHLYFDDIIICGKTEEEHDRNLCRLLEHARKYNIKFNNKKFQYKLPTVEYLGMKISKHGLEVSDKYTKAIAELKAPENKKELMTFLGLVKYLHKFIPHASEITHNLRSLTVKDALWHWDKVQQNEFDLIKKIITNAPVLKVFDKNQKLVIQCDSSQYGIGACISQNGQPIAFASRSLTKCEIAYSQIEKEMLAIVFAAEKFHYFIYGRHCAVQSDHKPLENIFLQDMSKVTTRLQRMRLRLMKYELEVKYLPGKEMIIADFLSRNFLQAVEHEDLEINKAIHEFSLSRTVSMSDSKKILFKEELLKEELLCTIMKYVKEGWPKKKNKLPFEMIPYLSIHDQLSVCDGLLFFNDRVVVPTVLREDILEQIHQGHFGINKCQARAKELVYWPDMNKDIEIFVNKCEVCQKHRKNNQREPLLTFETPSRPWQRISSDIFKFGNYEYVTVIDSYSKWIEVIKLSSKTSAALINVFSSIFGRFGYPEILIADNMPYNSHEFNTYARKIGMEIRTSSPLYPQSNGLAEKAVSISKNLLRKNEDLNDALLQYRNTPIVSMGYSPAELLQSRKLRDTLPVVTDLLQPTDVDKDVIEKKIMKNKNDQKKYYDRNVKVLPPLKNGDNVWMKDPRDLCWSKAKVTQECAAPRSYWIEPEDGNIVRRNSRFLRKRN